MTNGYCVISVMGPKAEALLRRVSPDDLSKEQRALLSKLAEVRGENTESVDKSVIHRLKDILQ